MIDNSCRLIIFAEYPEAELVKTRLISALGPDATATLSKDMTEHLLGRLAILNREFPDLVQVNYAGGSLEKMKAWLPGYSLKEQGGGDLGQRLQNAFSRAFKGGAKRVVIIVTDCPEMVESDIRETFDALEMHDLALGPASSGSYYLMGLKKNCPRLFEEVPWGSEYVLSETLKRITSSDVILLRTLTDIVRPEFLVIWEEEKRKDLGPNKNAGIISALLKYINRLFIQK